MLVPWVKIKIGSFVFRYCSSIQIQKSYTAFTDTAVITMPNVIYYNEIDKTDQDIYEIIKTTDPVEIWFGNKKLISEFKGFVTAVKIDENIVISCENFAFALKQINVVSKIFYSATIKQIIDHIFDGANITVSYGIDSSTVLGNVSIQNTNFISALQVLEHLQENYNINSFFDEQTLVIGQFTEKTGVQHNLLFERNIINNSLEFITDTNVRMVVHGVSIVPGTAEDTKIERWIYKENDVFKVSTEEVKGETRTIHRYNLTAEQLIESIQQEYDRYNYSGMTGNFTTFVEPSINPGDSVYLKSLKFRHKQGEYKVNEVSKTLDVNGAFQTVTLDYKLR